MIRFCALLLATYVFFSCEVATVKTVELPEAPERLVVIGLATNVGLGVYVSKTSQVLTPKEDAQFLDAKVSLLKGGTTLAELKKGSHLYYSDSTGVYNQEYELRVEHPILGQASATLESLPEKVTIIESSATIGRYDSEADISFSFFDIPGHDYYAYQVVPLVEGNPSTDRSVYQIKPGNALNDLGFENQKKIINVSLIRTLESPNGQILKSSQFRIYLYHLSKNTYDYYRSLREYDSYNEDTFAGMLLVRNNIINGYGFVGSCYIDSMSVSLE